MISRHSFLSTHTVLLLCDKSPFYRGDLLHLVKGACLSTGDMIYLSKGNLLVTSALRTLTPSPLQSFNCSSERDKAIGTPPSSLRERWWALSWTGLVQVNTAVVSSRMLVRTRSWPPHPPVLSVFPPPSSAVYQRAEWSDIDAPFKARHSTVTYSQHLPSYTSLY